MRFLLTNDDGIDAPGLEALAQAARQLGQALTVAPLAASSSCAHQVTTGRPVAIKQFDPGRIGVDAWPADCVRVALRGLAAEADWVLSGINAGGNLGADVYVSGTVAAVREGVLLGRPGIALSHYKRREMDFDWERASRWVLRLLPELVAKGCPAGAFWNVNLPHLPPGAPDPEAVYCPLDSQPLPVSFRREGDAFVYAGNYHARSRDPGGDVEVCFSGRIAVSLLRLG